MPFPARAAGASSPREEAPLQHRSGEAHLSAEQLQLSQELVGRLRGKLVSGAHTADVMHKSHITLSCLVWVVTIAVTARPSWKNME